MLETDEVDDDYFTPVASASLANIFGKSSVIDEKTENESLKYTPPKPQNVNKKPEDSKATSCVYACALLGYEWHNNQYSKKGRLGFALIKVLKTGMHNIILYDSNKTTLSNTSVTNKLKVIWKSNNLISYYDDQRKYWSLYGAENEVKTIIDMLKTHNVTIDASSETDTNPPEPVNNIEVKSLQEDSKMHIESDTDSSVNRKTKASILNRMANMGHSVLPPSAISIEKTSDSSDTNDTDYPIKTVRHKPVKGAVKRNSMDRTLIDHQKMDVVSNIDIPRIGHIADIKNTSTIISDQLVPLANTAIVSSYGNDMNGFITEQRISNSELRINIGRMTDKMDQIINKIDKIDLKDQNEGTTSINTEILHKLLREYESKIKVYEELFNKLGTERSHLSMVVPTPLDHQPSHKNNEALKSRVEELENAMLEKDKWISKLKNDVDTLTCEKEEQSQDFQKNISELNAKLRTHQVELSELTEAYTSLNSGSDVANKIKSVMNDTYQAVATNFENGEKYSGESIKKIIAMVIKKVTVSAINDL